ncbi:MAG: GHKL domain-containing protein [Chitinophagia bacterium]|nr:GHKL domain-containing protein [Chitinophagia bacterium]
MLSLVLVSFLILGTVTISFLFLRFEQNNNNNLLSTAQKFKEPIQQYIFNKQLYAVDSSVIDSIKLQHLLTTNNQNTYADVNIFDLSGKLLSTSNMQLFNQGIVAPILSRDAMRLLSVNATSILCLDDKIGLLHFKVAYMNLYDELGNTIAYVSMPIYTSEKEIRYQITYLIIAMTNLYAFIFVLSTLLAFVVTNGLTSSFNLIIKQFQRVNLQKMVKKLEESAHQLAQTEREDAWKEMAKQVAHEIKNPLTPMRLNLQFLQNAIKNKQDNTLEITRKVTDSLIEQIDNLNYIASEFSNFAKLPDPQIAVFSLNTILESSVSIYKNESTITISLSLPPRPIIIKSDKSHLLRVFSNLLQNAVQSIPEGKEGLIQVNLYTQNQLAVVQVKDNGSGIPSSIRENVFIPHFTTKNAGSGIGLAMTKRIVEYWHGSIWFESIESEGTDFYVALPFLDDTIA